MANDNFLGNFIGLVGSGGGSGGGGGSGSSFLTANSQAAMLALTEAVVGSVCLRTDTTPIGFFALTALPASTLANWKSGITGTVYGEVLYELSSSLTNYPKYTAIPFNLLRSSYGLTNFQTNNGSGTFTLLPGFRYRLEGFVSHWSSPSSGGVCYKWSINNTTIVGNFGGSAVATATDPNIGASTTANHLISIPFGGSNTPVNLVFTGWANINGYVGNDAIPSSWIKITAYNL